MDAHLSALTDPCDSLQFTFAKTVSPQRAHLGLTASRCKPATREIGGHARAIYARTVRAQRSRCMSDARRRAQIIRAAVADLHATGSSGRSQEKRRTASICRTIGGAANLVHIASTQVFSARILRARKT